ncbi:class I lanthipeptide [Chitinophaga qingshengii]|uniref:Class I lanthipeptide n=1 Tax=Chitinophaga qingshengii TaxID=1569794 RepID=A0ABR7TQV6_9BACT|nr:class I lanthipeptide [Chitinophaga qingshengii]MBC9932858.1 class I lanthipeptide [Chitinophaga qingshengii]
MRKKSAAIGKKLSFNKETIASLNMAQQQLVAGGSRTVTKLITCTSNGLSCVTYQDTGNCNTCP